MIIETLQELREKDVNLSLSETGNLKIDSPKNSLTDTDLIFLKTHKPEIILELSNVFTTVSGRRVINYIIKSEDTRKSLYYHSPNREAHITEVNIVRSIRFHNEQSISDEALKNVCNDYLDTHNHKVDTNNYKLWTKTIPLFSLIIYSQGKRIDSFTCNAIQIQIITALFRVRRENVTTKIIPLSDKNLENKY